MRTDRDMWTTVRPDLLAGHAARFSRGCENPRGRYETRFANVADKMSRNCDTTRALDAFRSDR